MMNKQTYYNIREDISWSNKIAEYIDTLNSVMDVYCETKTMTLQEVKQFLKNRRLYFDLKIQEEMDVK